MPPQEIMPPPFGDQDIPHIGCLYSAVRKSRDIEVADLVRVLNLRNANHITNFEDPLQTNPSDAEDTRGQRFVARAKDTGIFDRLVQALQQKEIDGKRVIGPLKMHEAKRLIEIYKMSNSRKKIETAEDNLFTIQLEKIFEDHLPEPLQQLLQRLRAERRPAFIADQLWFIHAINGAAYNLFGINPDSDYTLHWEAWHVLGAKFLKNSPVLQAHVTTNDYYPQTVDFFFNDTYPILFTMQMRALLGRLHRLSEENGVTDFEKWWRQTVTFSLTWQKEPLVRSLKYWGKEKDRRLDNYQELRTTADERFDIDVNFSNKVDEEQKRTIRYWIGIWRPKGDFTKQIFANLEGYTHNRTIYFAHDFEKKATEAKKKALEAEKKVLEAEGKALEIERLEAEKKSCSVTFHVNNWPEAVNYFEQVHRT